MTYPPLHQQQLHSRQNPVVRMPSASVSDVAEHLRCLASPWTLLWVDAHRPRSARTSPLAKAFYWDCGAPFPPF